MKNAKFYICPHCGNIAQMIHDAGVSLVCCGQKMEELAANSVEASHEKHIPTVDIEGGIVNVKVGSVAHPMAEDHWIQWVQVVTDKGVQRKRLNPGEAPKLKFLLSGEKPLAVYAYCNRHGLWKMEL